MRSRATVGSNRGRQRSAESQRGPRADVGSGSGTGRIARPRLIERLRAERSRPLLALVAPAGYGKSTLLGDWLQSVDMPVVAGSIQAGDNDAAALLGRVLPAIEGAQEHPASLATLDDDASDGWSIAAGQAAARLRHLRVPVVVGLDDAERLTSQSAVAAVVGLANLLPGGSQVIVAARALAGWPLAKEIAAGTAAFVGTSDLAFDATEVRRVFAACGAGPGDDDLRGIQDRTEGWPIGVSLEALAVARDGGRPSPFGAPRGGGALPLVADYVQSEVLGGLSTPDREFLLRTSHLERLSPGLCDAVVERQDSRLVLQRIESRLAFLTRMAGGSWYQLQRMVREVLLEELQEDHRAFVTLSQRGAAWFEANGHEDDALASAFAARDIRRIARLLPGAERRAVHTGRIETGRAWLSELERTGHLASDVDIATTATLAYAVLGDAGRSERASDIATRKAIALEDPLLLARVAAGRAVLCRGGATDMLADASAAVAGLPVAAFERPIALLAHGVAHVLAGDVDDADRELARAAEASLAAAGAGWEACVALVFRAGIAEARGDHDPADALARRARSILVETNLVEQPVAALVHAQGARFALRHGAMSQAVADLAVARRLGTSLSHAIPWLTIRAKLDTAVALLALSDVAGARVVLQEAREVLWWRPGLGTLETELARLEDQVAAMNETRLSTFMLTAAELRLLPLLATHLSLPEISERLFLSTNTIKTQAKSIYRKLDVVSRTEAVERAAAIGLLDPWIRVSPATGAD